MSNTPHFRNCHLCEAICGIEITVRDEHHLEIRGDKDDPFSRGYICPKGVAVQDIHFDKDRLRHPVRRTATGWERITWDEAFAEVASNLRRLRAQHGPNSLATYLGNPSVHNYGVILFAPGFIRSLKTRNRFSATSVDQLAHHLASYLMFGHQLLLPVPDVDRTQFFLMLGANPAVSNGSMMTAPGMNRRLEEIRARGGKVVLIDPRFNETARFVDRHLFIRPGTDVLLLLAVLQVVFAEGLTRRVASFAKGMERVASTVAQFSPERVATITGIEAEQIRQLAREFAAAESAVCYGRIGVSTQEFGGVCQWLINVLNIVTGNLDRPGGAMFPLPAFDPVNAPKSLASRGSFARRHTRVRKLPEFSGEFPVAALGEEILTDGPGQIKALVTVAGNPVLSTPNGRELDRALASLEFMVSIDCYINETTRHAQIILPPTSALERGHYDIAFHLLAVRNTAKFSPPLFSPDADAKHDWQILSELETRMLEGGFVERAKSKLMKRLLSPERMVDLGLRFGPYGLTLRKVRQAKHGIDLGPLTSCLPDRLRTSDKRIDLAPEVLVNDIERVKGRFLQHGSAESNGHLRLIGRRQLRSNNSWLHNTERLLRGKPQCTMLMHPADAAHRNLTSGQKVLVKSRVGSVEVPVEVSDEIMPGVVSIPHGWGHDRAGINLTVAQQHAGASINDLTDALAIDTLCGTAAFNGIPVTVEAIS
ncbi:MAG TPA: molybdopterin oxidoreductase family protein [Pyrinomonadaceae bacterium]|jgi:anaerobic selenocysteine-containing dehydrogenase|nr:molybdopterin oxidoreductase family protein [Pyrinomonadaceae bacterium]